MSSHRPHTGPPSVAAAAGSRVSLLHSYQVLPVLVQTGSLVRAVAVSNKGTCELVSVAVSPRLTFSVCFQYFPTFIHWVVF